MKQFSGSPSPISWRDWRTPPGRRGALLAAAFFFSTRSATASFLEGDTLDAVANALAWIVMIIVPMVAISAFWMVHILPEKIAEKRRHPQAKAIQVLCLLSLVFGGLLWPLAWIWAYTKPVMHKLAYGTDVDDEHEHGGEPAVVESEEVKALRARITELEAQTKRSGLTLGI